MRLHVFVALVTVLLLTACNPDGACIRVEPDRSSCVDIGKKSCVFDFKEGKTCEALGYTKCDANGCRKP